MTTIYPEPIAALDAALADLGHLHRRVAAETLTPDDYHGLMRRIRARLQALRDQALREAPGVFEITDPGVAVATAESLGRNPAVAELLDRLPELMTGRDVPPPNRMRTVHGLGVIDGDRP